MKNKKKKLFKIYLILSVMFVLIFFLFWWNVNLFIRYNDLDIERNDQIFQIEKSQVRNEDIHKDLKFLETDEGIEKILIEKNNFKKPGERAIKILDY
jgi:cell division protein FtsB